MYKYLHQYLKVSKIQLRSVVLYHLKIFNQKKEVNFNDIYLRMNAFNF